MNKTANYEKKRDYSEYYSTSMHPVPEHFHRSIEFMYCAKGERYFTLGEVSDVLKEGELLIIPPIFLHSFADTDNLCYSNVLPIEYSDVWDNFLGNKTPECFIISDKDVALDLHKHLIQINNTTNKILRRGIYDYVLGKIMETVKFIDKPKGNAPNFINNVLSFIDEHFNEDLSLNDIALEFGYSKYHFSNLFNKYFKSNLKFYINQVRITKATTLLRKHSLSEVSNMCGYNNLQSFFYNFKKITGETPKNYKNKKSP